MSRKKKKSKAGKQSRKLKKKQNAPASSNNSPGMSRAVQSGLAFHRNGDLPQAEKMYRQAIDGNPGDPDAYHYLGVIANQVGKYENAVPLIEKAISLCPSLATAHFNLGVALENLGRYEQAIAHYKNTISLTPDFVSAYNNLGILLSNTGRLDEAVSSYEKALAVDPGYADCYTNLANTLVKQDRLDLAIQMYEKALSIRPGCADTLNNLGVALKDADRLDDAILNFEKAVNIHPGFAEAYNNLGNVYGKKGLSQEAIDSFKKAVDIRPGYFEAVCNLGIELKNLGQLSEAVSCFRNALSLKPDHLEAMTELAKTLTHNAYSDEIRAMEALFSRQDLPREQKMHLGFALGKVFEELKAFDKAFACIDEANRLRRSFYEYNITEDRKEMDMIKSTFTSPFFSKNKARGFSDKTPVFIVGMPRSGSSLLEQILASHSMIFGAGELKDFSSAANTIKWVESGEPNSSYVPVGGADAFKKAGMMYIDRIRCFSRDAAFITDKMPHNFLNIGLIKACLPMARIIHCQRDPMDTCFSIFKHYFSEKNSHKYAYNQVELGRYYTLYTDLMAHWKKTLPDFVLDVAYESLIADLEGQTKKILDFIDIPWEDACLSFHKTRRKVATASAVQVRQPLYRDSIHLWKQYERHLGPLQQALASEARTV
ncbi:MAG: tetratricopeptide repeat protein [Desulfobacter sp.]